MTNVPKTVDDWVSDNAQKLSEWCRYIFELGEPAWREYRSAAWYVETLKAQGFEIESGSGGMPTAFCARWTNGDGPTVGMYAEYDAVPANCQGQMAQVSSTFFVPYHTMPYLFLAH